MKVGLIYVISSSDIQTTYVISFVFCSWIINEFEIYVPMIIMTYGMFIWEAGRDVCRDGKISEPQMGINPTTFWSPVRPFSYWATRSQMAEQRLRQVLVHMCDILLRKDRYLLYPTANSARKLRYSNEKHTSNHIQAKSYLSSKHLCDLT